MKILPHNSLELQRGNFMLNYHHSVPLFGFVQINEDGRVSVSVLGRFSIKLCLKMFIYRT